MYSKKTSQLLPKLLRRTVIKLARLRQYIARRTGLHSIQGRLIAIAFVFIIGTAVSMGITGYRFTASFERQRFHEHFNLLAGYMANNAELGVMMGDPEMLGRLCQSMLQIEDVQSITILDSDAETIIRRGALSGDDYGTASAFIQPQIMDEAALFPRIWDKINISVASN